MPDRLSHANWPGDLEPITRKCIDCGARYLTSNPRSSQRCPDCRRKRKAATNAKANARSYEMRKQRRQGPQIVRRPESAGATVEAQPQQVVSPQRPPAGHTLCAWT